MRQVLELVWPEDDKAVNASKIESHLVAIEPCSSSSFIFEYLCLGVVIDITSKWDILRTMVYHDLERVRGEHG